MRVIQPCFLFAQYIESKPGARGGFVYRIRGMSRIRSRELA